jgi:signal transduction histidine kinase
VVHVSGEPATSPVLTRLRQVNAQHDAFRRWARVPVCAVVVATGLVVAATSRPHPGLSGEGMAVAVAALGVAAGVAGSLFLSDRSRAQLAATAVLFASAGALMWLQPRGGAGPLGLLLASGMIARRLRRRPALLIPAVGLIALAALVLAERHRPLLDSVPVAVGITVACVFGILFQRLRDTNKQAQTLLMQLAESRGAEARAAALAERQRLAREIHDVLAHSLSGLILQLEGARMLAESDPSDPRLPATVARAHHLAKDGLGEARRAIGLLRDGELPGPGALGALTGQFERDSGIPCSFETSGDPAGLHPDARLALYRVTQEALTNVVKHASPARVEVHLAYGTDGARLTVEDFRAHGSPTATGGDGGPAAAAPAAPAGAGIPETQGDGRGHGLTGMRERAELLGGTLTAAPTPAGFRVELHVPARA